VGDDISLRLLYLETWQAKPIHQAESARLSKGPWAAAETGGDDLRCRAPPPAALPPMRRVAAVRETHRPQDSVVETTVRGSARTHSVVQAAGGKTTPAMAGGLTDHVWTVKDIISLMDPETARIE